MKIILNKDYGGFDVSKLGYELYAKKKGLKLYCYFSERINRHWLYKKSNGIDSILNQYFTKDFGDDARISDEDFQKYNLYLDSKYRTDETLIEVIEQLGQKSSGKFGNLKIVEIPDNSYYVIDKYDGYETIYYSQSKIMNK